ncbi:MAG: hypothetical protein JW819_14105 [Candidatus Krumholzibacteriota bacterium]|nr:hypothetical protein [Candidatus Krumholzibacteriota bacterium]
MAGGERREDPACALCGATEDLLPDPNLEGVWICRRCRDRTEAHQAAIEHGYDDEEPAIE